MGIKHVLTEGQIDDLIIEHNAGRTPPPRNLIRAVEQAVLQSFDITSKWTKEHVQNYPEAAAECLNRLLGHEPPQFTASHKTPYTLPSHVMDDIRRYGNECVAYGKTNTTPLADEWKEAVDYELVMIESTADSFSSPKEAVKALIDFHVEVATDSRFKDRSSEEVKVLKLVVEEYNDLIRHMSDGGDFHEFYRDRFEERSEIINSVIEFLTLEDK